MSIGKQIKKLAGESAIYGIAGVFNRFVSLFLFPVYSKILPPDVYGVIGMYNTTFFSLAILCCFALDSATFRFYFDDDQNIKVQKSTFSNWFFFQLALAVLLCIVAITVRTSAGTLLFDNFENASAIVIWMAAILIFYGLPQILEVWYRLQRKPVAAITYSISTTLFGILVTIYCIVYLKLGVLGFIYGQAASYLVGTAYGLYVLRDWIAVKYINIPLLKSMLRYALPLLPAGISATVLSFCVNYYLKETLDFTQLGLFSIGATLASSLGLITTAFGQAWSPFAFSIANDPSSKKTYSYTFTLYTVFMSLACLAFSIFLPDILRLLTNASYYDAEGVGSILSFNTFFVSLAVIGMTGSGIVKKTAPYATAVIVAAVLSLLFIYLIGHFYGKEGAAAGLLLGQLFIPVYVFYISQKHFHIPYQFKKVAMIVLISVAFVIFGKYFIVYEFALKSFFLRLLLTIVFAVLCFFIIKKDLAALGVNLKKIKGKGISKKETDLYETVVNSASESSTN